MQDRGLQQSITNYMNTNGTQTALGLGTDYYKLEATRTGTQEQK